MFTRITLIGVTAVVALGAISRGSGPAERDRPSSISPDDRSTAFDTVPSPRSVVLTALAPIRSHPRTSSVATQRVASLPLPAHLDPDDCFACHDDNTLSMNRGGVDVSLFVDPGLYARAAHSALDCVDCHVGFDPDEEPHLDEILPVDCSTCHGAVQNAHLKSGHAGELACSACHQNVHVPSVSGAEEALCQDCHEKAAADLAISAHAGSEVSQSCLDCHNAHQFRPAESSTCLTCHGDASFVAKHVEGGDLETVLAYENSIHGEMT
ncbi:MAG TPA: hypothetical protein VIL33_06790, partial [Rhodothermia bacterium]